MSAYVFLRLYWRPGVLLAAFTHLSFLGGIFTIVYHVDAPFLPDPADALLLIIPLALAALVSGGIAEVYNGPFSWTLPGLQTRFSAAVLACGVVAVAATLAAHRAAGGAMPAAPASALTACFYALPLFSMSNYLRHLGFATLFGGLVLIDPLVALATAHPAPFTVLALMGGGAMLYAAHAPGAWRRLLAAAPDTVYSNSTFVAVYTKGSANTKGRARRAADRRWPRLGSSAWNWLRACEYERSGHSRLGAAKVPLIGAACALMPAAVFLLMGYAHTGTPLLDNLRGLFPLIGQTGRPVPIIWGLISAIVFTVGGIYALFRNTGVGAGVDDRHPKLFYPLSRARRAQLSFWTGLGKNALYAAAVTGAYYAATLLCSLVVDKPWDMILPIVYPVALTFVGIPLLQSLYLHFAGPGKSHSFEPALIFAATWVAALLGDIWVRQVAHWPAGPQIVLYLAAALAAYALYHRQLRRHYARRDLVR